MDNILPTTKLSRGKVLGKALIKITATASKNRLKRTFFKNNEKEKLVKDNHKDIAKIIMDALGELKGVSVKIAQQIGLGMGFLPQEYLDEITKSFNDIPPINKALIRKIIKTELGSDARELFDSFDMSPFAAASLGQVHLALLDKTELALKVQYPGIKKSIESDMTVLHFGLKRFAKGQNIDHIIGEIQERLYEEVDYELEAKNTDFFRENLGMEDIVIPDIYYKFSTDKVLCSLKLNGVDLERFLELSPSQKQKDNYAQLIFDSFFRSLYTLKKVHADPNPGNFLFLEDDKLGMIDFGCVKSVDDDFLHSYNNLHLSLMQGAVDIDIVGQYVALGMIDKSDEKSMLSFYQEIIKPLDRLYIEPFVNGVYDFKKHGDFSKRGFDMIFEIQKKQVHSVHKLNQEFIFLDRALLGYYAIFEKLGAKIDTSGAKAIMMEYKKRKVDA